MGSRNFYSVSTVAIKSYEHTSIVPRHIYIKQMYLVCICGKNQPKIQILRVYSTTQHSASVLLSAESKPRMCAGEWVREAC